MPRQNPRRSVGAEANLAKRIAVERERRGLSYDVLARQMSDAGCPIQGSAIFRIENGDRPRRVTLDEAVTFAKVFGESLDDLRTPIELIEQRRAKELIDQLDGVTEAALDTAVRMFTMFGEYFILAVENPELHEYVDHRWEAATQGDFPIAVVEGEDGEQDLRLNDVILRFSSEIRDLARDYVKTLYITDDGEET